MDSFIKMSREFMKPRLRVWDATDTLFILTCLSEEFPWEARMDSSEKILTRGEKWNITMYLIGTKANPIYAHSSHLQSGAERMKRGIKFLVGTEHWLAFRLQVHSTVSCKAPSSNGKARPSSIAEARWASHAEGGNVSQAPHRIHLSSSI